ncbi:scavenger mRNA decapping enzyme [Hysterangium stoloniferum]|nr:scavenger mRNA decapping enzyme [Hysterangium stoloniferum]
MQREIDIELLRKFQFERVLDDDPLVHSLYILGKLPDVANANSYAPAIISLHKTHLPLDSANTVFQELLERVRPIEANDIYHWLFGWLAPSVTIPDVKINIIFPATDLHIRKYSKQRIVMVTETPEIYRTVVLPYIASLPRSRFEWVYNILSHKVEVHKILYEDVSPETGFIIIPDMKWDLKTLASLYLVAIVHSPSPKTLRELTKEHIPMLQSIRREAARVVTEKWGLDGERDLRFYIHYQPSYYHFHVHIVNANYAGFKGVAAGQAHILEDIISLLELSPPTGPTLLAQRTLTYQLGEQHGLYQAMLAVQESSK